MFACIHANNFCFADIENYKEEKKREKHCLYGRNKNIKGFIIAQKEREEKNA